MKEPTVMNWYSIRVVKISEVGEDFRKWLDGQTTPFVYESENPTDWAYYDDYLRWINGLPVID